MNRQSMLKKIKKILSPYYHKLRGSMYKGSNIYLIYSMGKVGSASVYTSLKRIKPYSDIFHVHFLSANWLDKLLPGMHEYFHSNITLGKKILKHIEKNPGKRIKIITLVREPVARGISEIFQNWKAKYDNITNIPNEELIDLIQNRNYDYTLNWFDTEFKEYTGVDIFELEFDKKMGYGIYTFDRFDLICIKLEVLNDVGEEGLSKFIGENLPLVKANISSQKRTSQQHKFVKENVRIDKNVLDSVYSSKLIRHFYTTDEITSFYKRWQKAD